MTVLTYFRYRAIDEFQLARRRAKVESFLARIFKKDNHLLKYDTVLPFVRQRVYRGVQQIPTDMIVGSVNRNQDFDYHFRPLKKHLLDRWARIYVMAQLAGWPAIQVHKVGPIYFVEDGHHRVSVARHLHNQFIDAEVWEHSLNLCGTNSINFCSYPVVVPFKIESHITICRQ
jgi:hypothetical protein